MPIPRIIHQLWKNDEIPARWKDASQAVRRCHRDWEYRLWTDSAIDEYMRREHPDFYPAFAGFNRHIMRLDVFRYVLMNDIGGLYCDLDYEFLRPYDYGSSELVLSLEYDIAFGNEADQIANYVFASSAGHPLWRDILIDVQANPLFSARPVDVCTVTGPALVTRIFFENRPRYSGVDLTHQPVFSPRRVHGRRERKIYINSGMTYGFHYGWGSWRERWTPSYLRAKIPRILRRLSFTKKY
jgi:mannosyltransferase OCH1-like enzyme